MRASPSWDVPIPDVVSVVYSPGALSYATAIVMAAGVVPVSVATMAPRIVAGGGGGGHGTISPAPSGAARTWELPLGPCGDGASHVP